MAYQTINTIFHNNETDLTASEAHGLATGMLCLDNSTEVANWLTELFPDDIFLIDDDKSILVALFEQTRKLLSDEDNNFRYELFLPGDDEPLNQQLEALCFWCEGFLFGIGFTRSASEWPSETREIMKDIVEFTKMDFEGDRQIEEDENALMEIQEYLRVAVIMIRDQFIEESNVHRMTN
jgi:yecA family protein